MTSTSSQGPAARLLTLSKRMLQRLVSMTEQRVTLVALELEEEKQHIVKLLLLTGASLLCLAFALMSLLLLIIWAIDPAHRLVALIVLCLALFVFAAIGVISTMRLSRKNTLLSETRRQLKHDLQALQEQNHD